MRHIWLSVMFLAACGEKDTSGDTASDTADTDTDEGVDADGDGHEDGADCDDSDAAIHPGAAEVCDGVDNDCDELVDLEDDSVSDAVTVYADLDGDGFGDAAAGALACPDALPKGAVSDGEDCDDSDSSVHPGAWELCDEIDQDCDGEADDCAAASAVATISGEAGELIGYAVDNSGDLDGDGVADLVVGSAPSANQPGAAWVLHGPFSGQHTTAEAVAHIVGDSDYDRLGTAAAIAGDYNEDGYDDLLIGAPGLGSWVEQGAAALYYGPVTGALGLGDADVTFYLTVSGDIQLGAATDHIGDVTGDGVVDLVITAPGYDGRHYPQGAVCVVRGPVWGEVPLDDNRDTTCIEGGAQPYTSTLLGEQVSGVGDLDGDGVSELAVGLQYANTVYVYEGPFGVGAERTLTHTTSSYAGADVDGAGDVNGDGYGDLVVGAFGEDIGGVTNAGAAYVVYGPLSSRMQLSAGPSVYGSARTESVGYTVAGAGDLNQDGFDDVVIGAPWDGEAADGAGAAYVVYGPLSGRQAVADVSDKVSGAGAGAAMGTGLAGGGGTALLAAPFADAHAEDGGDVLLLAP